MSVLQELGSQLAQGMRGRLSDDRLRRKLRCHVADTIAAWIAGGRAREGKALTGFVADSGSALAERVMLHCALARLSELDDIHLASAITPGSVVIPAALTVGVARGASGEAIAEAVLAGYEAMVRLGAAINGPSILYRGIWPTYFSAPLGVAAVVARLLELDECEAAHALALALSFASPGVGRPGGPKMSRWLALGHAAGRGCTAAYAAQAGFSGDLMLFEKDFFPAIYSIAPDLARLRDGLGSETALAQVSFKPWCAARQTMAAVQALKELVRSGVAAAEITAISIHVPPPYLGMVNHGVVPGERSSYLTSAPFQLAISLIDPDSQYLVDPPDGEAPEAVRALMGKVSVHGDEALMRHFPASWPARVAVTTSSGKQEKLMLHVPGDPERAFDEAQIAGKFRRVVSPLIGEADASRFAVRAFEALDGDAGARALLADIEELCRC